MPVNRTVWTCTTVTLACARHLFRAEVANRAAQRWPQHLLPASVTFDLLADGRWQVRAEFEAAPQWAASDSGAQ